MVDLRKSIGAPGMAVLQFGIPTLCLCVKFICLPFFFGYLAKAALEFIHCYCCPSLFIFGPGFGSDSGNPHLPHNHEYNQVVYTGTHDNDTVISSSFGL